MPGSTLKSLIAKRGRWTTMQIFLSRSRPFQDSTILKKSKLSTSISARLLIRGNSNLPENDREILRMILIVRGRNKTKPSPRLLSQQQPRLARCREYERQSSKARGEHLSFHHPRSAKSN